MLEKLLNNFSTQRKFYKTICLLKEEVQTLRNVDSIIFTIEAECLTPEELEEAQSHVMRRNLYLNWVYSNLNEKRISEIHQRVILGTYTSNDKKLSSYRDAYTTLKKVMSDLCLKLSDGVSLLYDPVTFENGLIKNMDHLEFMHNRIRVLSVNETFVNSQLKELEKVILLLNLYLDKELVSEFKYIFEINGKLREVIYKRTFGEESDLPNWSFTLDGKEIYHNNFKYQNNYHKAKVDEEFSLVVDTLYTFFQSL